MPMYIFVLFFLKIRDLSALVPKSKCISLSYSLKVKALSHVVAKKGIIDTKLLHIVVV